MKALKNNLIKIVCVAFLASFAMQVNAQGEKGNLEKIYTQTDRPFYFPGETIWFKSYVVNGDHTISTVNDVMYAELISPKGSIVKRLKLAINQGYAYGDFAINKNWVGGIYTMKMYTNWMHNYGDEAFFTKKITVQKVIKPNVLLSLKFEKKGYGKSSSVVANFEAKDLKNNPLRNTELSYEVSIKGEVILSKKDNTNEEGKAKLQFKLPDDVATRDVVLNIQIPHKGTTESISRSIPMVLDTIDLQFFPESGKLIQGVKSNVAFKAIDEFGKPVDVQGNIIDENGSFVTSFESFHDGMGAFYLNPAFARKYYAKLTVPFASVKKITLPEIHQKGVNFMVQTDSLLTKIQVNTTIDKQLYLEISDTENMLLKKRITYKQHNISIDTKKFPIGITKFRIVDTDNNPLAERLVFLNAHKQLQIDVELDKESYLTREKVKVTITTKDEDNNPIPSNVSVAIVDNKLLSYADDKQDHILSYLLLSSELKAKIHKPNFYFNPEEEKSYKALDYVMLTHGWRNYIEKPVLISEAAYLPEQFTIQSGKVVDEKGNPVHAKLLLFNQYGNKVLAFETNKKGQFYFKFNSAYNLTLIAYTEDGRKLEIIEQERLVTSNDGAPAAAQKNKNRLKDSPSKFNNPTQQKIKKKANVSVSLAGDDASLGEVVVVAYGVEKINNVAGYVVEVESEELGANESIAQVLRGRAAGIEIVNSNWAYGNGTTISIRGASSIKGNNQPLFIVDGVLCDSKVLSKINNNEIDNIAILKNAAATSLYGSAATNGVVVITTKKSNFHNWGKKKLKYAKYKNYAFKTFSNNKPTNVYTAKQFYIPMYDSKELPQERKDFRQTIYWNPVVQTDESGKASFELYNSDAITSFQVLVEGIGYNGLVGREKKDYATKKLLNVDFKSPNYMVLNDTVILPVTITNETRERIETTLEMKLPKALELLESYDKNIVVEANSSIVKYVKVKPIKKAEKVMIGIDLKSESLTDFVEREATILSPYFPTEVSISGSKSASYNFSVDHAVDGSLEADFTIYTDIIGDVMDGIEGMIRKPYGCFEQTSSATYPNIMVLKYLKEANKSNPEIEKQALSFIKEGYKRLISFETKKGGFEWFGKTPPHETLTAYGILEFTEMKEVFGDVDQKMIDRTVQWLLSRRDGKGGFNRSNKGYDSFASSPDDVANAYIIYALSESGVNVTIEKEYQYALQDALKTNDTYKMALLACVSFNLGENKNAQVLIGKIKKNIEIYNFSQLPVENTITRSYGNAKNIEAVAFSLLALLKEEKPDEILISQGIEHLVSKRQNNSFGSTQSTAMALKALIEYTKTQKTKLVAKGDFVALTINGKQLNSELNIAKNGKITINNIDSYITRGNQKIKVKFSNPKNTFPYSLNINYDSSLPKSSAQSPINLETIIADKSYNVGDNVSMAINVINKKNENLGMVTAIIGIPSGTTPQSWQLKKLMEENEIAYYEIFDNYLVFYWRFFRANETKTIRLDLKADVPGNYQAPASTVYLYYGDEFKTWKAGSKVNILK
ncbi:TonB-dependent receptor plug domain-containing protein [uncultured Kordia sp.]|uniref:TonB-dependent receptor plug domain-containing protein n=1 Tax=uncultured Kordia sp. TaxID=507699 RepID=UPI0026394E03|nr:TonB-dependent receptor plug domain-containing protein [uncultured Kordia sp.]